MDDSKMHDYERDETKMHDYKRDASKTHDYKMEELVPLVAELADKYTSKESTSISYDKAKQLMGAVLYCINEQIQNEKYEETNLVITKNYKLAAKESYQLGYKMVVSKVEKTAELYNQMIDTFDSYGNQNYYDTVVKGIPGFIRFYDPKFNPQNHILTLDYPTLNLKSILKRCGVDVIYMYLRQIQLEQSFLNHFPREYVMEVLCAYHQDYEELFINICNIVMRNVLGCMIAEKPIDEKGYSEVHYSRISEFTRSTTRSGLKEKLQDLLQYIIKKGYDNNHDLYEYLSADMDNFSCELENAVEHNCLNVIFLL